MYRPLLQDQGIADHLAQLGPVLYACATHVIEGSFEKTDIDLSQIKRLTSIADGPLQRLSLIIADSLARRLLCPIQGFAGALIHPSDYFEQSILQTARFNFTNLSPYISTGFATINRAILEAMEDEQVTVYNNIKYKYSCYVQYSDFRIYFVLKTLRFSRLYFHV